jgi:hypothetical protein
MRVRGSSDILTDIEPSLDTSVIFIIICEPDVLYLTDRAGHLCANLERMRVKLW